MMMMQFLSVSYHWLIVKQMYMYRLLVALTTCGDDDTTCTMKWDLPHALMVDGFSRTRVRNRNEPKETKRDVAIKISMACSVMLELKKKMTATAPDCQKYNCAKAASCIYHFSRMI
jgi:hypothetical protein